MKPQPSHRRWSDGRRINALDPVDFDYWTKFFGVEGIDLLRAVDKVGTSIDEVKNYLDIEQAKVWIANGGRMERRHFIHK